MALSKFHIQLMAALTGVNIAASGGVCYVAQAGDAQKATLYNADGTSLSNPIALNRGNILFCTAGTDASVDLYIMTPGGQFVVVPGVVASGPSEIAVDTSRLHQVAVIPFAIGDTTATTETDTGFDLPLYAAVLPHPLVRTTTIDSGITIEAGLLSSETAGDADGFIDVVSVATAGLQKATIANSGNTLGALFEVQDSANAGDLTHEVHVVTGSNARSITYTLSSGADTAEGFILLPYILAAVI